MLIECKIKRPDGSIVTIEGVAYDFQPDDLGRHVAEVDNEQHAERLLSIDAYRKVEGKTEFKGTPKADNAETLSPGVESDLEAARAAYLEKFGKKPHHSMKAETIYERIEAGDE